MKPYWERPKIIPRTVSKRDKLACIAHYARQFAPFCHVTGDVLGRSRYGFYFFTTSEAEKR